MKPTDEERREVAAELRELAKDYEKVPAWDVIAAGDLPAPIDDAFMACGLGRAVYATEIFGRLADLIEPEERTCHAVRVDVPFDRDAFPDVVEMHQIKCSECGSLLELDWRYCPQCGSGVVYESA